MIKNMLTKKLKMTPGHTILAINAPTEYLGVLGPLPEKITITERKSGLFDAVHLFVHNQSELKKFGTNALSFVKPGGLIWIFYPKKTSKMQTDLSRDVGWDEFSQHNLQWMSLISFDKTWSACALKNAPPKKEKKSKALDKTIIDTYVDHEKRIVNLPEDLKKAFKQHQTAAKFFSSLSFTNRKEYVVWLITAKQESTRLKRLNLIIDKLHNGLKNPADKPR